MDHIVVYMPNGVVFRELQTVDDDRLIYLTPTFNSWRMTDVSKVTLTPETPDYYQVNANIFTKLQNEDTTLSFYTRDNGLLSNRIHFLILWSRVGGIQWYKSC